ncbi:MAG: hypothetical protein JWO71_4612, partial [Candidatus Acidoferrum typicum]|nr:hypothetical protein [Candidatus Acidoferrum typicum]
MRGVHLAMQLEKGLRAENGPSRLRVNKSAALQNNSVSRCNLLLISREFVLPAGDYYSGQAVAQDVYGGAAHVHQLVDAEKKEEGLGGEVEGGGG